MVMTYDDARDNAHDNARDNAHDNATPEPFARPHPVPVTPPAESLAPAPGAPAPAGGAAGPPWWAPEAPEPATAPRPATAPIPTAPVAGTPVSRRPRRGAAFLVAGVLAGGLSGGAVAGVLDRHGPLAVSSTGAATPTVTRSTATVSSSTPSVAGTPESAASVIAPSVVTVEVTGTGSSSDQFGLGGQQSQSVSDTGSGVILRSTGYILTNNHVVSAATGGGSVSVTLTDGRTVPAKIVGTDPTSDLAVIKVTGVSGLTAATFADSEGLKVGQAVLAVGAPLGLSNTVTQGIVSTLHRPVATGESGATAQSVIDAVQTDAAINPGNSGGALVDLAGRVVGINSAIATTGSSASGSQSGNIGVGFAIPSTTAGKVADQLINTGHATHSQIGISAADSASSTNGAPGLGAGVRSVSTGGPADSAGLVAGDVIVKVGNRPVTDANSLIVAIRALDPGTKVSLTYRRGGVTHTAQVTLARAGG